MSWNSLQLCHSLCSPGNILHQEQPHHRPHHLPHHIQPHLHQSRASLHLGQHAEEELLPRKPSPLSALFFLLFLDIWSSALHSSRPGSEQMDCCLHRQIQVSHGQGSISNETMYFSFKTSTSVISGCVCWAAALIVCLIPTTITGSQQFGWDQDNGE